MLLLSLYDFLPHTVLDDLIPLAHFAAVGRTLPQWYPGTGDASLLALLYAIGLITWERLSKRPSLWRVAVIVVAAACILAITKNRSSLIVAPILAGSLLWLNARALQNSVAAHAHATSSATLTRSPSRRRWWPGMLVLVCLVAIPVTAELFSRARLVELHEQMPATGSAFGKLATRDVRPAMWRRYAELGMAHLWIGVGFGRTVPATAYRIKEDPAFLDTEAAGLEHAHNYLLNLWLQLGAVGLVLLLWAVCAIIVSAAREASKNQSARVAYVGVVGIVFAVALRNLTDDFMVYGTAIAVWAQLGWWLGVQQAASTSEAAIAQDAVGLA